MRSSVLGERLVEALADGLASGALRTDGVNLQRDAATRRHNRQTPTERIPVSDQHQRLASFIWQVADLLRGDYKQSEYGKVILPFTVLRRLDCVLAPTKDAVLERKVKLDRQGQASPGAPAIHPPSPVATGPPTCGSRSGSLTPGWTSCAASCMSQTRRWPRAGAVAGAGRASTICR